jgi:hypothetical protein
MPSRFFQDYNENTPITSNWLNGVNNFIFGSTGTNAQTSPAAWIRFNGTAGTVQQSYGVTSIVRNSAGNYTITFNQTLPQSANCYSISTNLLGQQAVVGETANSVTIETANAAGISTDVTIISVVVFGAYLPPF